MDTVGWHILKSAPPLGTGWYAVVDCEFTHSRGLAFIDMLTDSLGTYSPPSRTLAWALREFDKLNAYCGKLPVYRRCYFTESSRVVPTPGYLPEPSDGVVAIHLGSTAARKIKPVKSVELQVQSQGLRAIRLVTSDGIAAVPGFVPDIELDDSDIVELRLSPSLVQGEVVVHECFRRVDKSKANSSDAVRLILESMGRSVSSGDENDRRHALLWCNSLRSRINRLVETMPSSKAIILDVGTGDGQSLDSIDLTNQSVSRILIELDALKINTLVANCTLGELIYDAQLSEILMPEVRAIVSTFSVHYVVHEASLAFLTSGTPIYACGYVYDGIDVGQCLVDTCGVVMKRVSRLECEVRWGGDNAYTEPCTTSMDYGSFCNVVDAGEVLEERESDSNKFIDIDKHVKFFQPRG
ncbi:hypothetical protein ColTof3_14796 [Colletotrichum tofieldiae]|nr:hypothetical protein ColTof3_14796 [Colletotrichum tofieldiae]